MTAALTATAVRNARPSRARRDVPDAGCPGLVLTIEPTGSKRWALRYRRPDGRSARLVLGSVYADGSGAVPDPIIGGHLTLASARRLAAALRHQIAQGVDPAAEHQASKQRHLAEIRNTFA